MATVKGRQVLTNIYLEPEVYSALKKLSTETGAPMAFYLRKAVDKVLAEHGIKVRRRKETKP
jgi:predicted DNA-binding protein